MRTYILSGHLQKFITGFILIGSFIFFSDIKTAFASDFIINPNLRVFPDTVTQVETTIATHPLNPMIMAGAAVTDVYPGGYTTGVYLTTNGGLNWHGNNAIKDSLGGIITTVGNPKIIIDKNGTFILTYIAPSPRPGAKDFKVGVSYSTNNGTYWSRTVYIPGIDTADKCICATDNVPESAYYGNSYVVYNERRGIYFSCSTNSGMSWSAAKMISPPIYYTRTGAFVTVGQNGEVYVTWPYLKGSEKYVGFARSTNGGATWESTDTSCLVYPVKNDFRINLNLVKTNCLPNAAVDNSGGPRNGWIYFVSSERLNANSPAYDSCDVTVHCSTDKGATWPYKYKVNRDSGTYHYQIFPAINIDNSGNLNVVYYDTRNTITRDSFQVYLSRSTNGGQNFEDILLSDHKFKLKQMVSSKWLFAIPSYIGTGIGVTSSDNKIIPFWFDNSVNDEYQAFTSIVEFKPKSFIKAIPEGFFNSVSQSLNSRDTLKIYLRNSMSPYSVVDSAKGKIDSVTFNTEVIFSNAVPGNYYVDIKHRNSIETWSKNPVSYSSSTGLNFDFTSAVQNAFGDNLTLRSGKWCLYSGDINRDEIIDIEDISILENDISNNVSGYINSDVNGDGITDASDMIYIDNNSFNNISCIHP